MQFRLDIILDTDREAQAWELLLRRNISTKDEISSYFETAGCSIDDTVFALKALCKQLERYQRETPMSKRQSVRDVRLIFQLEKF